MSEKKYTIRSKSDEGTYYLVNGWKKCKTFWIDEKSILEDINNASRFFFTQIRFAKANLVKLLKIMDDYWNDKFEIVEITEDGIRTVSELMVKCTRKNDWSKAEVVIL